jgi:hypothetical protein
MSKSTIDTSETIARIRRLKTPGECRNFAANAKKNGRDDLVPECRLREAELLAASKAVPAHTALELRLVRDMCLIEQLSGKRLSRTWPMIRRHGFIGTVERIVTKPGPSTGFELAMKNGLPEATFEAAVLANPSLFSAAAIEAARARLALVKESAK